MGWIRPTSGKIFFSCLGGGMVYARVSKTRGCNDLESSSLSLGTGLATLRGQSSQV